MDNSIATQAEADWPFGPEKERLFPVGEGHGRSDSLVIVNMRYLTPWVSSVHSVGQDLTAGKAMEQ